MKTTSDDCGILKLPLSVDSFFKKEKKERKKKIICGINKKKYMGLCFEVG
jgi:hypothetical protein